MASPETCAGALTDIKKMTTSGSMFSLMGYGHTGDAYTHWGSGQDHAAIEDLCLACYDYGNSTGYLAFNYNPWVGEGPMYWYLVNCVTSFEMTMEVILTTMLAAKPNEVEYFVGLVDAYRQSIWNRPFNQEFFAALSRGFMQWP